eukprot:92472-Rhodomonas_salina.1
MHGPRGQHDSCQSQQILSVQHGNCCHQTCPECTPSGKLLQRDHGPPNLQCPRFSAFWPASTVLRSVEVEEEHVNAILKRGERAAIKGLTVVTGARKTALQNLQNRPSDSLWARHR